MPGCVLNAEETTVGEKIKISSFIEHSVRVRDTFVIELQVVTDMPRKINQGKKLERSA